MSEISFDMIFSQIKQYLAISEGVLQRLHLGLWANERRHFAVLAGLSGSGKTQLAIRYAEAVSGHFGHEPKRFVLPVQPGWHDPTPLFGYVNPLSDSKYERPAFLDFVLEAARTPEQPFFVILDEMNLSHPEHYFAPVLSAMETGDALTLHNEDDYFDGVPSKIPYPNNIAIIGTVNMDETTHGISDKVLDRAFTIEFWDIDLETYPRWGSRGLSQDAEGEAKKCLQGLINSLSPVRLHFGWRTVDEVLDYLQAAEKSGMHMETSKFLDQVVHSKVLPKLRGTESYRLQAALENTKNVLGELGLSESENKLAQLTDDLKETGLMRFWR